MAAEHPRPLVPALALLAATALVGGSAIAESPSRARVVLVYEAPPACPPREAFVDAVASRLGYDPFVPVSPERVAVVVRSSSKEGFSGTMTMGGSRTIASSDCHQLVDSLAVAVALGIDPESAMRPAASEKPAPSPAPPASSGPPPAASSAPPPPPPPEPRPSPTETAAPRHRLEGRLALGPYGSLGETPSPTAGLLVAFELVALPRLAFEVEASASLPSSVRIGLGGRGAVDAALYGGLLAVCVPVPPLSFCGTGSLAAASLGAEGVDVARPETALYGALGLRASLRLYVSERFFFRVQLDGQAPLTRFDLRIDGASLWTTAPLVGRAGLLAGVAFR